MDDELQTGARRLLEIIVDSLPEWMNHDPDRDRDDVEYSAMRRRLVERLGDAAEAIPEAHRGDVLHTLFLMTSVAGDLRGGRAGMPVREAEAVVRAANIDRLHDQYDRGERGLVWPPPPGTDWDEIRVATGHFMDRKAGVWPQVAFADKPALMVHSPFETACQGAQFFISAWIERSREELIDDWGEQTVVAWEEFLELDVG